MFIHALLTLFFFLIFLSFFHSVLGIELRSLCMLVECLTTELHLQDPFSDVSVFLLLLCSFCLDEFLWPFSYGESGGDKFSDFLLLECLHFAYIDEWYFHCVWDFGFLFFNISWKILCHFLLSSMISDEKLAVI